MAKNIEGIARRLGANAVCRVPDISGGAFGMARLAGIITALQARLKAVAPRAEQADAPPQRK